MSGRDRILTAELAAALQADAVAEGELLAWIVTGTEGEMVARPVTAGRGALAYVLTAETLPALRALLPAGLVRLVRLIARSVNPRPTKSTAVYWPDVGQWRRNAV